MNRVLVINLFYRKDAHTSKGQGGWGGGQQQAHWRWHRSDTVAHFEDFSADQLEDFSWVRSAHSTSTPTCPRVLVLVLVLVHLQVEAQALRAQNSGQIPQNAYVLAPENWEIVPFFVVQDKNRPQSQSNRHHVPFSCFLVLGTLVVSFSAPQHYCPSSRHLTNPV